MKYMLIIVLAAFVGANVYLYVRGYQALPEGWWRKLYTTLFVFMFASFFAGMIFGDVLPIRMTSFLQFTGTTWLFALIYLVVIALFFDLLRAGNKLFDFFPTAVVEHYSSVKLGALCFALISTASVFVYGVYRFNKPVVQHLNIKSEKSFAKPSPKIVMLSDVHLGYTIGKKTLRKYVELINAQNPDAVLFCGDTFDRSLRPVKEANMAEELNQIKAPLGVFLVPGNHEYYGNLEEACEYLREAGIKVLRDSVVNLTDEITLIGRDDFANRNRKKLSELMQNVDRNKFIIALDHQPVNLDEAEKSGVDFQFSGHIHNGQIFPLNLVVRKMYEKSYGYLRKGSSHFYVTSGLGIWGAHLRIGTVSEIVVLNDFF
jgi:predicted MPP superfamily phosphohydrolase